MTTFPSHSVWCTLFPSSFLLSFALPLSRSHLSSSVLHAEERLSCIDRSDFSPLMPVSTNIPQSEQIHLTNAKAAGRAPLRFGTDFTFALCQTEKNEREKEKGDTTLLRNNSLPGFSATISSSVIGFQASRSDWGWKPILIRPTVNAHQEEQDQAIRMAVNDQSQRGGNFSAALETHQCEPNPTLSGSCDTAVHFLKRFL
ncbi:hypothetical protein Baya_10192 [Bagarius yarrelli]|uniref:Transmembrane protein n=1 Tax=Bagarius yarrelli TaxID=175774 RepID=A0A556UFV4_BAGYA|nr:hypothetical protein Baya_10192 [Bagarius yarrelli]